MTPIEIQEILPRVYNERQLSGVTGVNFKQFKLLLAMFKIVLIEQQQEKYKNKDRKPGSGRKGVLEKPADKLFFILHYLKCYPTFDHLGFTFNIDNGSAFQHVKNLLPLLTETLNRLNVLPKTCFETPEEMQLAFPDVESLLIDATERAINRPQDDERQKENYSGKKNSILLKTLLSLH